MVWGSAKEFFQRFLIISSTLCNASVPLAAKRPQGMMLQPPCLTSDLQTLVQLKGFDFGAGASFLGSSSSDLGNIILSLYGRSVPWWFPVFFLTIQTNFLLAKGDRIGLLPNLCSGYLTDTCQTNIFFLCSSQGSWQL